MTVTQPVFDPLEMLDLADALKYRRQTVTLGKRKFSIRYDDTVAYVKPIDGKGQTPCGWFDIQRVIKQEDNA